MTAPEQRVPESVFHAVVQERDAAVELAREQAQRLATYRALAQRVYRQGHEDRSPPLRLDLKESSKEQCVTCGGWVRLTLSDRANLHAVAKCAQTGGFDWRHHRAEFLTSVCGCALGHASVAS